MPKIRTSLKGSPEGNWEAKITYGDRVMWSNAYGSRRYAEMGITRNLTWVKQKIADEQTKRKKQ